MTLCARLICTVICWQTQCSKVCRLKLRLLALIWAKQKKRRLKPLLLKKKLLRRLKKPLLKALTKLQPNPLTAITEL